MGVVLPEPFTDTDNVKVELSGIFVVGAEIVVVVAVGVLWPPLPPLPPPPPEPPAPAPLAPPPHPIARLTIPNSANPSGMRRYRLLSDAVSIQIAVQNERAAASHQVSRRPDSGTGRISIGEITAFETFDGASMEIDKIDVAALPLLSVTDGGEKLHVAP